MTSRDPRQLIALLMELSSTYRHWEMTLHETLQDCEYQLRLAGNRYHQSEGLTQGAVSRSELAKALADQSSMESERCLHQVQAALRRSQDMQGRAAHCMSDASACQTQWSDRLRQAIEEFAACQRILLQWQNELEERNKQLYWASQAHKEATTSLRHCRNCRDKEGSSYDCSRFETEVNRARQIVFKCEDSVKAANEEVRKALNKRGAAQDKVKKCETAAKNAQEAVRTALSAKQRAEESIAIARDALSHAQQAESSAKNAIKIAHALLELGRIMKSLLADSNQRLTQSAVHISKAGDLAAEQSNLTLKLYTELSEISQLLESFNFESGLL